VYFGVTVTGLYYIGVAIANGILCGPKGGQDRVSYLVGSSREACNAPYGTVQILSVTSGSVGLATDLFLFVLPLPVISKLELPRKRKTGVLAIFTTASV
jgi:hypothetical protein